MINNKKLYMGQPFSETMTAGSTKLSIMAVARKVTGPELFEGSNPVSFPAMAFKLFIDSFLQVQVYGLVLCGRAS
jgi:hypothetical protein